MSKFHEKPLIYKFRKLNKPHIRQTQSDPKHITVQLFKDKREQKKNLDKGTTVLIRNS